MYNFAKVQKDVLISLQNHSSINARLKEVEDILANMSVIEKNADAGSTLEKQVGTLEAGAKAMADRLNEVIKCQGELAKLIGACMSRVDEIEKKCTLTLTLSEQANKKADNANDNATGSQLKSTQAEQKSTKAEVRSALAEKMAANVEASISKLQQDVASITSEYQRMREHAVGEAPQAES